MHFALNGNDISSMFQIGMLISLIDRITYIMLILLVQHKTSIADSKSMQELKRFAELSMYQASPPNHHRLSSN